ncbi:hypothetical protein D9758_006317 [Tetrapyrgos nigripes]|uniref:Calpain catalytic domain-containing protein n=1 Tax=Tetrapyrgos nigripes TaxID=182062 RepID=A0A8H5G0I6_9AGAR|nr:hypothetical protein D9758_006317 [Tetrapyrgos nigripes]
MDKKQIKNAESAYSKATQAELAKDFDSAYRLYIKSAESFIYLSGSTSAGESKTRWNNSARKALERAEKLKAVLNKPSTTGQAETGYQLASVAVDHFSVEEQAQIVRRGAVINGRTYPPWDQDLISDPELSKCISTIQAPGATLILPLRIDQPALSSLQQEMGAVWRRDNSEDVDCSIPKDAPVLPEDISQNIVTDCSLCASISVCLEHDRRFRSRLAESVLHKGRRVSGIYDLRILYNATFQLTIDDRLPYHSGKKSPLCLTCNPSSSEQRQRVLWPSFIEKGYMKLMGGYDFPGSNSGIDLHALIGWIPEHVSTRSSKREETWARILKGFFSGRCMVTLGTGVNPAAYRGDLKLLPSHCYAVTNVREVDGARFLTILDSWVSSTEPSTGKPRVLELAWSDVLDIFDGIYLSWDPTMWHQTLTYHGKWKVKDDQTSASRQIRVNLQTPHVRPNDKEIWVLLTRHVVDTRGSSEFIALNVQLEDDFLGHSVTCTTSGISDRKGPYTNSPHFLTRVSMPVLQASGTLSIEALYEGSSKDVGFSLTVYADSEINVDWIKDTPSALFSEPIDGVLTSKNSGGNPTQPTFMINPQYLLRIPSPTKGSAKAKVTLTMKTLKDVPVQIMLVWSNNGERLFEPSEKDIVSTSGKHSYGFARLVVELSPGDYNIILSAFEPHHTGPYSLVVDSSLRFSLSAVPQEGAGKFSKLIKGSWNASNAMGGPSFQQHFENPVYELELKSQASVQVRLQLLEQSNTAINVTIYAASEHISPDRHFATSGAYDSAISGVVTPDTTLSKGKWWIIPSTYNPGVQAAFQLIVYSTASIDIQLRR